VEMMAVPEEYQRLLKATQGFNNFNLCVDLIAISLFALVAIATANKLLPKKIVDWDFFDFSWKTIGICSFVFLVLLVTQLFNETRRRRVLSAFEREAAIKAARKNNFKSP
jgi:hypothetical protein